MDDPIAIMLKFGFLAVLYLFLLWVARSALKDVAGGQATALIDDTGPTARPRGEFMYIEDMGSTNGTFLNGRQLRKPEQLKVADSVRIGDTEYRYQE